MTQKLAYQDDRFHDHCGVVGVFGHAEAAKLVYLGLYALQHRGQESAGIVSSDGHELHAHRAMGEVEEIFTPDVLNKLPGSASIGHTRYSTAGDKALLNAQPIMIDCNKGKIALGHNGNLTNAAEWRRRLEHRGSIFQTNSDTEVVVHLVAKSQARNLSGALGDALNQVEGAYSLVVLTPEELYAVRDPRGFRPLNLAKFTAPNGETAWIVASETCAFDLLNAHYIREIEPGEMLRISKSGLESIHFAPEKPHQFCIFEHVYFARPDSTIIGRSVNDSREALGRQLAREHPVEAGLVVPEPDSGVRAAGGYATESGIPYGQAIIKNRYSDRTFIKPDQRLRELEVDLKFNMVKPKIEGMRLVVVDDSIVRGNTMKRLVAALRHQGVKQIHLRSSSPPLRHPCYFGIDIPQEEELIAAVRTAEEIAAYIGVDSLGYLSTTSLGRALASVTVIQSGADKSAVGAIHRPLQDAAANTLLHNEFCYGCMNKHGWPFDPLSGGTTPKAVTELFESSGVLRRSHQ